MFIYIAKHPMGNRGAKQPTSRITALSHLILLTAPDESTMLDSRGLQKTQFNLLLINLVVRSKSVLSKSVLIPAVDKLKTTCWNFSFP